jgi:hypothetical protein
MKLVSFGSDHPSTPSKGKCEKQNTDVNSIINQTPPIYVSILYIVCVLMEHRVVFFLAGSPHSHTMENLDVSY